MKIVSLIVFSIFSLKVFSNICGSSIEISKDLEKLEQELQICKAGYGASQLKERCECLDKNEYFPSASLNKYNKILANSFEKMMEKSIYSISNDLSLIGNLLDEEDKEMKSSLFKSCNIDSQFSSSDGAPNAEAMKKCISNSSSFANSLEGIDSVKKKLEAQFADYFNVRKSKHINIKRNLKSEKFCSDRKDKTIGFVKRCSDGFKADCDMSDNIAEKIHINKALSDFEEILRLAKKSGLTPFNKNSKLSDQFLEVVFQDEANLDYRLQQISSIDSIPYFQTLLDSVDFVDKLNSSLDTDISIADKGQDNKLRDTVKNNLHNQITKKCDNTFKKAIKFLCEDNSQDSNSKRSIPENLFKQGLDSSTSLKENIQAMRYYCTVQKTSPMNIEDIIKPISEELYPLEQSSDSIEAMANSITGTQSQKSRTMLCLDIYNGLPKLEAATSLREEITILNKQIDHFTNVMRSKCSDGKLSEECSYILEFLKITEDKLTAAKGQESLIEFEKKEAKKNKTKYTPKSYLVNLKEKSFAESILLTKLPKDKNKKESSPEIKTKEKSKQKPKKATSPKEEPNLSNQIKNKPVESTETNSNVPSFTNGATENISLSLSSPTSYSTNPLSLSNQYQSERSKRIDEDIEKAQKYLSTLTDDQKEERKERIEQIKFENATQALTNALKPSDYIEEQNHIDKHTMQDEGRVPASTKIANPITQDLRNLENKILNETINRDLASDDKIELKKFTPGDSGLINEHNLVDSNGNVLDIIEVKIKGSIEEDFTKVLEQDEEKAITKDRKMILADPSQDAHFKNLAKALVEKETFLISRYDNEDIKLIIKYNNQSKDYTVEPYADKERLSIYEEDYLEFQKNISNAIKDKTFKILMKKYSKKLN